MARTLTVEGFGSNNSSGSLHTYNDVGIGVADQDRRVVVSVAFQDNGAATLDSATIGGVTADILIQAVHLGSTSAYIIAAVPFGTTATIIVNFSATQARGAIQAYRMIGYDQTPLDTGSDGTHASGVLDLDLDVSENGVAIATICSAGSGTTTWVGVTEDYDFDMNSNEFTSGGSVFPASAASPLTLNSTSSDTTPTHLVGASVSFRPITITRATTSAEIVQTTLDRSTYGSWSLVATYVAAGDATIDVIDLQSDFVYKFFWSDIQSATDQVHFWIRTSTDNGISWDAAGSDYAWSNHTVTLATSPGHVVQGDNSDSQIEVVGDSNEGHHLGNGANEDTVWEFTLFNPSGTEYTKLKWEGFFTDQFTNVLVHSIGAGVRLSAADVTGVRFLMESGNIASGTLKVYAIKA